jgi:hypothetical protein
VDTTTLSSGSTTPSLELTNTKESLREFLQNFVAVITFTKKDGTERVMKCTLKQDIAIPHERKTERVKEPKDDLLPVWDIDTGAWRTITVPNILTVEIKV